MRKATSASSEAPPAEPGTEAPEPAAEAETLAEREPRSASTRAGDAPATRKSTRTATRRRKTSAGKNKAAKKKRPTKLAAPGKPPEDSAAAAAAVAQTEPPGEPAAASDNSSTAVKPFSPKAQVEETDGAIVIHFPPVAPPPFGDHGEDRPASAPTASSEPEPAAPGPSAAPEVPPSGIEPEAPAPAATQAPTAESEPAETALRLVPAEERGAEAEEPVVPTSGMPEAVEAPPGRKRRRRGRRKKTREPQPEPPDSVADAAEPETTKRPEAGEVDRAQLSASQKRRLRRKRRTQLTHEKTKSTEQQPEAAEPSEPPADTQAQAAPATMPEVESPSTEESEAARERGAATGAEARKPKTARKARRSRSTRAARVRAAVTEVGEEDRHDAEATDVQPSKEMVINVSPREECRIAILRENQLEEIYIERASAENHVGNIYKGIVTNVESSIQAAFVDFGLGKNGFLHISDLHPQHFPDGTSVENVGRKMPRRNRPPIQRCLRRGQQVIVQITKEGIGTKGPTLSTYLSIPGRFLVMMPGMRRLGVSRKIEDDEARAKLRTQLGDLELPEGMGFIARTAAQGRTKRELQSDLKYLSRLWHAVEKRIDAERAPAELYRESDLVTRTIRDLYTPDIGRIIVDDPAIAQRARDFLQIFSPRSGHIVTEYTDSTPIFHKYGIEAELERLHSRHVPLGSGGSLVIDPTEALVAIDVNSGRFRAEDDAETTAFKINLEAADEVARQLRLRDLGGVIICDFIDMRVEAHKREVERRLAKNLKEHKERAKILRMSAFGIIEMTRQRQRASLTRNVYQDCRHCHGTGLVKTPESVTLDVMRTLQQMVSRDNVKLVEVKVSTEVAMLLLNRKRAVLTEVETKHRRTISVRPDPEFGLDQVEIRCWDQRGRAVAGE